MKFFKKHKLLSVVLIVILIVIILGYFLLKQFMPDLSKSEYGNRLDGISSVKISSSDVSSLKSDISKLDGVNSTSYNLEGRLVNIIIDVADSVTLDKAKEYSNKALEYFSTDEKAYYDFQVFVTCNSNEKSEVFPVIGYKHKTSENLVWKQ